MHKLTLPLVLLVLLAVVLVLFGARLYQVVPVGHVAVATLFGSVRSQSYPEGLHIPVNPLYQWTLYDVREKSHKEVANIPSQDQLQTELDVSVQYRVVGKHAPTILQQTGTAERVLEVHLVPKLRSILREQGKAVKRAEDFFLEETQTKLQTSLMEGMREYLEPKGVEVQAVLIRDIRLPPFIVKAIEAKKEREQEVEKQRAETDLAGTFDESNIKAKVGVAGFSPPGYSFDVEIDKLDLTRYQPTKPAPATAPDAKPGPEEPIDLSALKALNANGSIRIGALKASKIKASNVRIDLKALDGRVNIDPLAANLYGGSLSGAIGVNAQGTPRFSVKQTLAGVNIAPMLMDIANFQRLEGRGDFALNVTTAGQTVTQIRKALNGTAAANLADGAIRGINIAATIREAKTTIARFKGQQQTAAADTAQKTDFAELKATFNIANGVASNRDLVMTSPALRVVGEGDIDLGNARMNYLLKARLNEAGSARIDGTRVDLASITIPVRVTGPLEAPTYQFDFGDLAASVAGQALQDQIQKKLGGKLPPGAVGDVLQDAVKGLFRR